VTRIDPSTLVDELVAQGLAEPLCWEALDIAGGARDGMAALLQRVMHDAEGHLEAAITLLRYEVPRLGDPPADADDFRRRLGTAEAERIAPTEIAGGRARFLAIGLMRRRLSVCIRCGRTRRCWHLFARRIPLLSMGSEASPRNEAYVDATNRLVEAHVRTIGNPAFAFDRE